MTKHAPLLLLLSLAGCGGLVLPEQPEDDVDSAGSDAGGSGTSSTQSSEPDSPPSDQGNGSGKAPSSGADAGSAEPVDASVPGRSPCSTGPAAVDDFAYAPVSIPPKTPECLARCGVAKELMACEVPEWPIAALPNGSCSVPGETCTMRIGTFQSPSETGYRFFLCTCASGAWSCDFAMAGGGMCSGPSDAGDPGFDAGDPGFEAGAGTDCTMTGQVPTPVLSPDAGAFGCSQHVTILEADPSATVFYTTDGTNPTLASTVYNGPILIAQSTTLRAFAARVGCANSNIVVGSYEVEHVGQASAVTFSTPAGVFTNDVSVEISTFEAHRTICYTLDGAEPTCSGGSCDGPSTVAYGGAPIPIAQSGTQLRAVACAAPEESCGPAPSELTAATYDFIAAAAVASPDSSALPDGGEAIELTTVTRGGEIHYTLDGSDPTCDSTDFIVDDGFTPVLTDSTVIRTIVCKSGYATSLEADFTYTAE